MILVTVNIANISWGVILLTVNIRRLGILVTCYCKYKIGRIFVTINIRWQLILVTLDIKQIVILVDFSLLKHLLS